MSRIIQGKNHIWQVEDKPIGSGDAGEVYHVVCVDHPQLSGVLKKPTKVATIGTIQRQARQIAQEAEALTLLNGLPTSKAHPPHLLDQAPEYTLGTADYFIISETAHGEDLPAILAKTRQSGKPFPRRIILTVLDALFDLFSRAHEVGILWNDVKLEHIFWDNSTGQIDVIDWGNALFINKVERQSPLRWEDYKQLVEILGSFLQITAPELYDDLGWDEFQGLSLDSTRVSVLARRISYHQQNIAHQVMEYQSLIQVVLRSHPSVKGLRNILDYRNILEKIGAPWPKDDVLSYCVSLVEVKISTEDRQGLVAIVSLIWDLFDESLNLPWHLLREYCRIPEIISNNCFFNLVKHSINSNWNDSLWELSSIASQTTTPTWWDQLMPVIRQSALDGVSYTPYEVCLNLYHWAQEQGNLSLVQNLHKFIKTWRTVGADLKESPFNYPILSLIKNEQTIPIRLGSEIKQSYLQGGETIAELQSAWTQANLEALPSTLRKVISWDPDRWGILALSTRIEEFQKWLHTLYTGPKHGIEPMSYLSQLSKNRPVLEHLLGMPPWLSELLKAIDGILLGAQRMNFHPIALQFFPWILGFAEIGINENKPIDSNPEEYSQWLSHFQGHLKTWSDIDSGLAEIQSHAPQAYQVCNQLAKGFDACLSLFSNDIHTHNLTVEPLPSELDEAQLALNALSSWRDFIAKQDLSAALAELSCETCKGWALLDHAQHITTLWKITILPLLGSIHSTNHQGTQIETIPAVGQKVLSDVADLYSEITPFWLMVYDTGIHVDFLNGLSERIEQCQVDFLNWRKAHESDPDLVSRLLYHNHINIIKKVSNHFMNLMVHVHQASLAFTSFQESQQVTRTIQIKHIENVLYHLSMLEQSLITNPETWHFPGYIENFNEFLKATTNEKYHKLISDLPEHHPFYTWLVKSIPGYHDFHP